MLILIIQCSRIIRNFREEGRVDQRKEGIKFSYSFLCLLNYKRERETNVYIYISKTI